MLNIEEKVYWLERIALNNDEMARLALESNWTYDFVENIHSTMELFWQKDPNSYSYVDVEEAFREQCGLEYQHIKSIFYAFYHNGEYSDVLTNYLKTNAESSKNNIPLGYHEMYEDLVLSKQA